jgi:type 1 glutamine amidotransferase
MNARLWKCSVSGLALCTLVLTIAGPARAQESAPKAAAPKLNTPPSGFRALFNGRDLAGWKGLVGDPRSRAKMTKEQLAPAQQAADAEMRAHWSVKDGVLVFDGKGNSLCTAEDFGDFEMYCDWKIEKGGDSGIYLRGSPQVQIWDTGLSAQNAVGSGGLFNNQKNPSKPLTVADKPVGEWNTFYIKMIGDRVTVLLNGQLVVDNVVLENYWERDKPIYPTGQIELQNHGNSLYFRNIYIREIVSASGVTRINEALPTVARARPKQPRKALIYTHAAGYVHSSIPYGAKAVYAMGQRTGAYDAVITDNPAIFDADKLAQFDAIVLVNTTGDWLQPSGEQLNKLSAEEKSRLKVASDARRKAILEFIAGGKGLVGFHASSDSQYQWPDFGQMIGGYFDGHPWHEKVPVKLEDTGHPLLAAFAGKDFEITDEIYQFKNPYNRKNVRVLLSLDFGRGNVNKAKSKLASLKRDGDRLLEKVKGKDGKEELKEFLTVDPKWSQGELEAAVNDKLGIHRKDKDFAVAWVRNHEKGRVFYSSLGHREEIYWNPTMLRFYLDGIQFAMGDLAADATPSGQ